MLRNLLLLTIALSSIAASAQEKVRELSLRDALSFASGRLRPQSLEALQWIPGTSDLSYVKENALIRSGNGERTETQLVDLAQLQEKLMDMERPQRFPEITWLSAEQFMFKGGNRYHTYDLITRSLTHGIELSPFAERVDIDPTHRFAAYTQGGDLQVIGNDPLGGVSVTKDGTEGIVNGRSVHREEYGITKGTFWDPTGSKLAFYRMDESMVTKYELENIATQPSTFNTIRYPMAGQTSHQVTLGVYDRATYSTVFIQHAGAPDDYLTNITWTPDGKQVCIIHLDRATQNTRVVLYDATTGGMVRTLLEEHDEKWLEPMHPVEFLKKKRGRFLYFSARDGWMHLYLYGDQGLIRQVTSGNWTVQRILGFDAQENSVFVEGTALVDQHDPKGALERHIYRVDLNNGAFVKLTKGAGTHSGELSPNGKYILDTWSSTTVAQRTEVIDATNGSPVKLLMDSKDPFATIRTGKVELLTIPGENGVRLNARLIKPSTFDPQVRYPVIVYVYNGPHSQMLTNSFLGGAQPWMLHAAERGYIVFTVDGHGTENRGRDFEQVIHRRLGITEVKDQLHGVEYLKTLSYVDGERMGVHGWSFGGHVTTALMLRAPKAFKVGIAGGPVMDWAMYEVMYTERYMDTPAENPEGYAASRLTDQCSKLEGELLVIHGQVDDVVLPEHSFTFLKDCISNNEQVEFFIYPGHPHNVRGKDRLHLMTQVLERFDRELLQH